MKLLHSIPWEVRLLEIGTQSRKSVRTRVPGTNADGVRWTYFAKQFVDILLGGVVLICIAPLMIVISILVRIESKEAAIYKGKRLGKDCKLFDCYKFRTMYANNEKILVEYINNHPAAKKEWFQYAKLKGYDPRVTRVGRWLRKFSLDELPQVFNVLKGEMSLVGPRPYLPRELERIGEHAKVILKVKPGITGLWQVSGRNGISFDDRVQLETAYVLKRSLWGDVVILVKTIKAVIHKDGAY